MTDQQRFIVLTDDELATNVTAVDIHRRSLVNRMNDRALPERERERLLNVIDACDSIAAKLHAHETARLRASE
jgi:hypothetical protein